MSTTVTNVSAIAALVLAAASSSVLAQSSLGERDLGAVIYTREAAAQAAQQAAWALSEKARARGKVRVIVGLDVALRDVDQLSLQQETAQVRALEQVQNAVAWRSTIPARRVVKFESIPYMSTFVTRSQLQRLLNDPRVVSIQEDVPVQAHLADSVPLIRANVLWRKRFRGGNRTVVVLDTGADYRHSMLRGKVVAGLCRSTTQPGDPDTGLPPTTSTCPGGRAKSNRKGSGRPCTGDSSCDHGTHVASIAVGRDRNLKGVARSATLISGKVFSLANSGGTTAFFTDINSALDRILRRLRKQYNIDSINMSLGTRAVFGTPCDTLLPATAALINKLFRRGIATVISSGNGFSNAGISAPACIKRAVAVGSTNKNDTVSGFSNHHALVDVMAPGGSINAAIPTFNVSVAAGPYGQKSGTSMAAPHVAGLIALLKDAVPGAGVRDVVRALKRGVPVSRGGVIKRRIDANRALRKLQDLVS